MTPDDLSGEKQRSSTGHSTSRVYTVEARLIHDAAPVHECGMLLDQQWRAVHFLRNMPIGVPSGLLWNKEAESQGYLSYESAMALAYWFLASCSTLSVETRLVEHEFEYSFKSTRVTEGEPIERHVWSMQRKSGAKEWSTESPKRSTSERQ